MHKAIVDRKYLGNETQIEKNKVAFIYKVHYAQLGPLGGNFIIDSVEINEKQIAKRRDDLVRLYRLTNDLIHEKTLENFTENYEKKENKMNRLKDRIRENKGSRNLTLLLNKNDIDELKNLNIESVFYEYYCMMPKPVREIITPGIYYSNETLPREIKVYESLDQENSSKELGLVDRAIYSIRKIAAM